MTSHFAVLGLPEMLLPEEEILRAAFHAAGTRVQNAQEECPELQDASTAWQTLRQPAKRLLHLLALHGKTPVPNQPPPAALQHLFFELGGKLRAADQSLRQHREAAGPLQKALSFNALLEQGDQLAETQAWLQQEQTRHLQELQPLQDAWPNLDQPQWQIAAQTAEALSYLEKWQREIQERLTSISETTSGAIL